MKWKTFVNHQALHKAQKDCSNWNNSKCLGVMFKIKKNRKTGYKYQIGQFINTTLSEKPCIAEEGCPYLDKFVLPGVVSK